MTARLLSILPYWLIVAQLPAYLSNRPEVQEYTADALKEAGRENFVAAWRTAETQTVIDNAYRPAQPLLVAVGAYDRQAWVSRATTLWSQAAPDVHPVVVPGACHAITQDNPAYTTKMLVDFVRRCVRTK